MKPRLSRSLRRILAGVVVCCQLVQADRTMAATPEEIAMTPCLAAAGYSWRSDMERQLRSVRDHTLTMGDGISCCPRQWDPKAAPRPLPRGEFWAAADIDYQKLYSDNGAPGYKYHAIGGSVGMAGRIGDRWLLGGALAGSSGRIRTHSRDANLSADPDSYYASIFTRFDHGCWNHELIGMVGLSDVDFKRHGYFNDDYFRHSGSPDCLGLGVMYEVSRSFHINRNSSPGIWWQPVLNVTYVHSRIDSYGEGDGDYAVSVGDQRYNNVVFGFGARVQMVVGANTFNRDTVFNARVLGKAMTGHRSGHADIHFADTDDSVRVHTSSRSKLGVEVGAGFAIPLGERGGDIFAECTAEFADNYRSVNGALGYRLSF